MKLVSHENKILMWSTHNVKHIQKDVLLDASQSVTSTRFSWEAHTMQNIHRMNTSDDMSQFQLKLKWVRHRQQHWSQSHRHQWIRQTCWEENELSKKKKSAHAIQHVIWEQIIVITQYEKSCSFFLLCQEQDAESLIKRLSVLNQCSHIMLNCRLLIWQHIQILSSCMAVNYSLLIFRMIRFFLVTWQ